MPSIPTFIPPNWKAAPQPNRIYNGPAVPTAYDPAWQYFTNLTKDQVAWFQAQPEWQDFVSYVAVVGPAATLNANVTPASIAAALNTINSTPVNASPISK